MTGQKKAKIVPIAIGALVAIPKQSLNSIGIDKITTSHLQKAPLHVISCFLQ